MGCPLKAPFSVSRERATHPPVLLSARARLPQEPGEGAIVTGPKAGTAMSRLSVRFA